MLLLNSIQVTESISGSVVPLAMFICWVGRVNTVDSTDICTKDRSGQPAEVKWSLQSFMRSICIILHQLRWDGYNCKNVHKIRKMLMAMMINIIINHHHHICTDHKNDRAVSSWLCFLTTVHPPSSSSSQFVSRFSCFRLLFPVENSRWLFYRFRLEIFYYCTCPPLTIYHNFRTNLGRFSRCLKCFLEAWNVFWRHEMFSWVRLFLPAPLFC